MSSTSAKKRLTKKIIKGKKDRIGISSLSQKSLPRNFAPRIMNLEILISRKSATMREINELVELYSTGVEFYESRCSVSYNYFLNKIKEVFSDEEILEEASRNQVSLVTNFEENFAIATRMRESWHYQNKENKRILNEEVQEQEARILSRLSNRKRITKGNIESEPYTKGSAKVKRSTEKSRYRNGIDPLVKRLDYDSKFLL